MVAQDKVHRGAMMGIIANGGRKSIGNMVIEIVHDGSDFPVVQIYQCALGIIPKVQTWQRTKTKVVKKEVIKKPKTIQEQIKIDTNIESEDAF